jgi:hypothetical protein
MARLFGHQRREMQIIVTRKIIISTLIKVKRVLVIFVTASERTGANPTTSKFTTITLLG